MSKSAKTHFGGENRISRLAIWATIAGIGLLGAISVLLVLIAPIDLRPSPVQVSLIGIGVPLVNRSFSVEVAHSVSQNIERRARGNRIRAATGALERQLVLDRYTSS